MAGGWCRREGSALWAVLGCSLARDAHCWNPPAVARGQSRQAGGLEKLGRQWGWQPTLGMHPELGAAASLGGCSLQGWAWSCWRKALEPPAGQQRAAAAVSAARRLGAIQRRLAKAHPPLLIGVVVPLCPSADSLLDDIIDRLLDARQSRPGKQVQLTEQVRTGRLRGGLVGVVYGGRPAQDPCTCLGSPLYCWHGIQAQGVD